jgi:hypothetical protein
MKIKSEDMKIGICHSIKGSTLVVALLLFGSSDSYGQFQMGNTLAPLTGNDYPIINSNDAKGGHHQVAAIVDRDAITSLRRQVGMLCTVLDDGTGVPRTYQLICADTKTDRDNNANWVLFSTGSGTLAWSAITGNPFNFNTVSLTGGQLLQFDGTNWVNIDKTSVSLSDLGVATANISMGNETTGYKIINLADPENSQDAATKNYVDAALTTSTGSVSTETSRATAAEAANASAIEANANALLSKEDVSNKSADGTLSGNSDAAYPTVQAVKTYVDALSTSLQPAISLKADLASPVFTGTPVAPTAAAGTSTTQLATTEFVTAAVSIRSKSRGSK